MRNGVTRVVIGVQDHNREDHGVCVICESVRSFVGGCLGCAMVRPEYLWSSSFHRPLDLLSLVCKALRMTMLAVSDCPLV